MSVSVPTILKLIALLLIIDLSPANALIIKRKKNASHKLSHSHHTPVKRVRRNHERRLEDAKISKIVKSEKPEKSKQVQKTGNRVLQACNSQSGSGGIVTLGLVALLIYMIYNDMSGMSLLFSFPIFLTLITRLFSPSRRLKKLNAPLSERQLELTRRLSLNSNCKSVRVLRQAFDQKFFNQKKVSVVKFLKANNMNRKLTLTQDALFGLSKRYFEDQGTFKNTNWIKQLKGITEAIWNNSETIKQVMGLLG